MVDRRTRLSKEELIAKIEQLREKVDFLVGQNHDLNKACQYWKGKANKQNTPAKYSLSKF